jgi:hypothetical protein
LPIIKKLGGCDCTRTDEEQNVTGHEKAKARDVAGIKKQLQSLGISQK